MVRTPCFVFRSTCGGGGDVRARRACGCVLDGEQVRGETTYEQDLVSHNQGEMGVVGDRHLVCQNQMWEGAPQQQALLCVGERRERVRVLLTQR